MENNTFDLLIIFDDYAEKVISGVVEYGMLKDYPDVYYINKNEHRAFISKEHVLCIGYKADLEPEQNNESNVFKKVIDFESLSKALSEFSDEHRLLFQVDNISKGRYVLIFTDKYRNTKKYMIDDLAVEDWEKTLNRIVDSILGEFKKFSEYRFVGDSMFNDPFIPI